MLALSHESIWLVPFSIFLGGLIGSPHCLSMCGPIVFNFANQKSKLWAYQAGRMLAYVSAGAVVGAFGESLLGHDRPLWISNLSLCAIGLLLMMNGYRAIMGKSLHLPLPPFLNQISMKFWRFLRKTNLPQTLMAGTAGVFTVFLPCGHLYSFLIGAVATGSAIRGSVYMFAFWLGSMPLLSFGGVWLQKIMRPTIGNGQRWAGVLLVLAGLFSVLAFGAQNEFFSRHNHKADSNSQEQILCH